MTRPRDAQVYERRLLDGSIAYWAKLTVAVNDRRNVVLGHSREGMDRAQAIEKLRRQQAAVTLGKWQDPDGGEPTGDELTFHAYASEWLERKRRELRPTTIADYEWRLTSHLLPFFAKYRLAEIDRRVVDRYRDTKLAEREEIARRQEHGVPVRNRSGQVVRPLSNRSINMTIDLLSNILTEAVEHGLIASNPATGRRRRLKAAAPRRTWLMPDEVIDLINAAERIDRAIRPATRENAIRVRTMREQGRTLRQIAAKLKLAVSTVCRLAGLSLDAPAKSPRRAIVATLVLAGLRAGELCELRWRDVDLAHRVLHVRGTKTDRAARSVKLLDRLREELTRWQRAAPATGLNDLVFPTAKGRRRDTGNLRQRVLAPAIREADRDRIVRGLLPLPNRVTPHSLRRTFISLLLANGRPLPTVQRQAGHSDAHTTLNIYAQVIDTDFGAKERLEWLCEYSDEGDEMDPLVDPLDPAGRPITDGRGR